jgi:hypothetical protein
MDSYQLSLAGICLVDGEFPILCIHTQLSWRLAH